MTTTNEKAGTVGTVTECACGDDEPVCLAAVLSVEHMKSVGPRAGASWVVWNERERRVEATSRTRRGAEAIRAAWIAAGVTNDRDYTAALQTQRTAVSS